jgi:hypothetical protein
MVNQYSLKLESTSNVIRMADVDFKMDTGNVSVLMDMLAMV